MPDFFIGIILAAILLGLYLFFRGWYHRERDGGLYCRACQYRVDQSQADRCPECGIELREHQPRPGRPARRGRMVAVGLTMAGIGAGFLGVHLSGLLSRIDIYMYVPTWYLFRSDVSANNGFALRETDELRRRALNGDLDADELTTLARYMATRATNMWNDVTMPANLTFSGLTLKMLRDEDIAEETLTGLLQAVIEHQMRSGYLHRVLLGPVGVGELHALVFNESQAPFDDPNLDLTMEARFCSVEVTQGERQITVDPWLAGQGLTGRGIINWAEAFTLTARIEFRIGNSFYPQVLAPTESQTFGRSLPSAGQNLFQTNAQWNATAVLHPMDQISAAWQTRTLTIKVPAAGETNLGPLVEAQLQELWEAGLTDRAKMEEAMKSWEEAGAGDQDDDAIDDGAADDTSVIEEDGDGGG